MADITMCTQTLCPNSGHCYRVQAKKSDWQSMATFDYTISVRGVECDNYMPIYRTVATDSAEHNTTERPAVPGNNQKQGDRYANAIF